jgi:hypothetical protein
MFNYHILKNGIVLSYEDAVFDIAKGAVLYAKVLKLIQDEDFLAIRKLVDVKNSIDEITNSAFSIKDGKVYSLGNVVNAYISKKIVDFYNNGLPFYNLLNFWNNLITNESEESINELYLFLEHNKYPLTEDGHFIAYKMVTRDFKDMATGSFDNSVGSVVQMDRSKVCSDRHITCASGLHAASYEYANGFRRSASDVLIQVKINPADVVSVPFDYNNAKLRCCRYEVISAFVEEMSCEIYETIKVGNYLYQIEEVSLEFDVYSNFKKRKPSAIPVALKIVRGCNIHKLYIEKVNGIIQYHGIYEDEFGESRYFLLKKV